MEEISERKNVKGRTEKCELGSTHPHSGHRLSKMSKRKREHPVWSIRLRVWPENQGSRLLRRRMPPPGQEEIG